jgi:hypothetical protein
MTAGTHTRSTDIVLGIAARIVDWPKTAAPAIPPVPA